MQFDIGDRFGSLEIVKESLMAFYMPKTALTFQLRTSKQVDVLRSSSCFMKFVSVCVPKMMVVGEKVHFSSSATVSSHSYHYVISTLIKGISIGLITWILKAFRPICARVK